jgi:hypothetical protein
MVPASVLAFFFALGTLLCSAATSSGFFSASGFASPSAEISLIGLVCPWLPLD